IVRASRGTPTRERRAINLVDDRLGELIGREYVRRFFDPQRKAAMLVLANNVKAALRRRLATNDWMTPATRDKAVAKLDRMTVQVGYPDVWRDYSGIRIVPGDLYGNVERSMSADWERERAMLAKPVDRRLWDLTPQTINAYNSGQQLKIVFPAARLQPPFFSMTADPAVNYGGIGAIIGHELTHSFDNAGRQIDVYGNFKDWWTPTDVAEFDRRIAVLGAQYDAFEPLPGQHVNGQLTMGENIADLGGLLAALDAYHASLGGKPAPVIDGLTGDQRFFLSYTQVRRSKDSDDFMRATLSNDDHAPNRFRVIGAVRNVDAWYGAFGVKPGEKYYLASGSRARIW
ncbi:MAG: M13 family metallopeptidase, partial [Sphingomonas sp.]|uniref:M13-type metalloendopeptidase n=1 Tax=Sphingomonas sp. TaxID=28214 RepID=UPI001AD1C25F